MRRGVRKRGLALCGGPRITARFVRHRTGMAKRASWTEQDDVSYTSPQIDTRNDVGRATTLR